MILYINGDSHTAAAEAVNPHAFAEDDSQYFYLGRVPHPDNLAVSWGKLLADIIKAGLKCDAESAGSNTRIIRTTRDWLQQAPKSQTDILVVIQWSTWERQEWLIDGTYYQVNASGIDDVPVDHQQRYKEFVASYDWHKCMQQAHSDIWAFHNELSDQNIRHVFFNGNNHFEAIAPEQRYNWGKSYIDPYDSKITYHQWLQNNGFDTVAPKSWHYGREAHAAWCRYVLQYIVANQLI